MMLLDYRRSRHLTQEEAGRLVGVSRQTVNRWDKQVITLPLWGEIEAMEAVLAQGPHPFIARKLLDPFTLRPMAAKSLARMGNGEVFASYENYRPDDV